MSTLVGREPGNRMVDAVGDTTLRAGLNPGWKASTTRWAPARMTPRRVARTDPVRLITAAESQNLFTAAVAFTNAASTSAAPVGVHVVPHLPSAFTRVAPAFACALTSHFPHLLSVWDKSLASRSNTLSATWLPAPAAVPARRIARAVFVAKPIPAAVAWSQASNTALRVFEMPTDAFASRRAWSQDLPP